MCSSNLLITVNKHSFCRPRFCLHRLACHVRQNACSIDKVILASYSQPQPLRVVQKSTPQPAFSTKFVSGAYELRLCLQPLPVGHPRR